MGGDRPAVVVAEVRIVGGVEIKSVAPAEFRVQPGQAFEVRFRYDLEEASADREEYTFRLESKANGKAGRPAEVRWGDKWGVPQGVIGYVKQDYSFDTPGEYELDFEAAAAYSRRKWLSRRMTGEQRDSVKGSVRIRVG